jgi:hypothetical protein
MIRRITVGVLTLLLALLVIGSIFYIPQSALNTLKPVPAHAQIVYRSNTPGWFLNFFPMIGKTDNDISKDWKNSAPQRSWFQALEKSPLTVASVSLGGSGRRDTWVAVSALGPRSVLLRWQLKLFPPAGIKPSRSYGAWPVWQYSDPALPVWARVRFSIAEGLLICSISDDSHDLDYLLDTLDGRRPSAERKDEL